MRDRTRRDLLTGAGNRPTRPHWHISSAVISVLPQHRDDVEHMLRALPGAEIHYRSESKIVVVLEGDTSGVLGSRLADIAGWKGVLSANMVFEQALGEDEIGA